MGVEARVTRPSVDESFGYGPMTLLGAGLNGVVFVVRQRVPRSAIAGFTGIPAIGPIVMSTPRTPTVGLDPVDPKHGTRALEKALVRLLGSPGAKDKSP